MLFVAAFLFAQSPLLNAQGAGKLVATAPIENAVPAKTSAPAAFEVKVVSESEAEKEYVYASPHFSFTCNRRLTPRVVAGFAKIYEGTYEAVKEMPWGMELDPKDPDGLFEVKLFTDEADFLSAGGTKGSAGTAKGALSLVQLQYIGVKDTGSRLILEDVKDNSVIVHELTHALRNKADSDFPTWAIEGFAEYVASAPYDRSGRFSFQNPMKSVVSYIKANHAVSGSFEVPLPLKDFFASDRATFYQDKEGGLGKKANLYYVTANLVITYLWHGDKGKTGKGPVGGPVRAWLKAIHGGESKENAMKALLDGRTPEEMEKEIIAAYRGDLKLSFKKGG